MKRKILITVKTDDDTQPACEVNVTAWPQILTGEMSYAYGVALAMLEEARTLGPVARITVDGKPPALVALQEPTVREQRAARAGWEFPNADPA